jgi:hypothetical protein
MVWASLLLVGVPFMASAQNEDVSSTNHILPGCRQFVYGGEDAVNLFKAGDCVGTVTSASIFSRYFLKVACIPDGVTYGQEVRVVLKYVEDRPERQNEPLLALAMEAIKGAWPCPQ